MDYVIRTFKPGLLLLLFVFGVESSRATTAICVNTYDEVDMQDSNCLNSACSSACTPGSTGGGHGVLIGSSVPFAFPELSSKEQTLSPSHPATYIRDVPLPDSFRVDQFENPRSSWRRNPDAATVRSTTGVFA
jgi:hypothetical protein